MKRFSTLADLALIVLLTVLGFLAMAGYTIASTGP